MKSIVLCSGGLDSVAALMSCVDCLGASSVRAVGFRYGQPAMEAELYSARSACERLGVPYESIVLSDALRGGILEEVRPAGVDDHGVNTANVPARNLVFLATAAARAGFYWPKQHVSVVIGAHKDDADTFPDCRPRFLQSMTHTAKAALEGVVASIQVEAPWIQMKKSEILWLFRKHRHFDLIIQSMSCYSGTRCGTCGACVQRSRAFTEAVLEDSAGIHEESKFVASGGDPSRSLRR